MNGVATTDCNYLLNSKKAVEPKVDLGNLLLEDLDPVDETEWKQDGESYLAKEMRDNVQYLVNKLWQLPKSRIHDSVVVDLPAPSSRLPREKPLPKPRAPTRWEEFAKMKGIKKRKKDRMVWDEEARDWRPAWGYKRANDETKDWLIEVPDQADPYEDFFGERLEAKKERVAKNEFQRLRNIQRAAKASELPSIGVGPQSQVVTKKDAFEKVERARKATASVGQFTPRLRGEKVDKGPGKRRHFLPNETSVAVEKDRYMKVLNQLESKTEVLNVDKAVRLVVQQKHEESHEKNLRNEGKRKRGKKGSGKKRGQNKYSSAKNGKQKKPVRNH